MFCNRELTRNHAGRRLAKCLHNDPNYKGDLKTYYALNFAILIHVHNAMFGEICANDVKS